MPIVAVFAKDWAMHSEQAERKFDFDVICGWVVGLLVREDDDKIVITHEWFPSDDHVRCTSVIPKLCILERIDYEGVTYAKG